MKKQKPSQEALKVLFQRMRYEYDFYNYVKDQFHLLKRKFGLKTGGRGPSTEYVTPSEVEGTNHVRNEDDDTWLKDIYG